MNEKITSNSRQESSCRETQTNHPAIPAAKVAAPGASPATPIQSGASATSLCPLVFSKTGKMPGPSWSIPATSCLLGAILQRVPGTVCAGCYALRGNYLLPCVKARREENLRQMREPDWVERMVEKIRAEKIAWFRWFDSGDLLALQMLVNIVAIANGCPDCRFWLPTRQVGFIQEYVRAYADPAHPENCWPVNLTVRLSATNIDGPAPTGVAQRLGCTVSRVVSTPNYSCHAPSNGGSCGDCRACWQRDDFEVVYHQLTSGRFQPGHKNP